MSQSNIKLVSNIMIKSKYKNDEIGSIYLPYEILSKSLKDSRNMHWLSNEQQIQMNKYLLKAKRIVDIEEV